MRDETSDLCGGATSAGGGGRLRDDRRRLRRRRPQAEGRSRRRDRRRAAAPGSTGEAWNSAAARKPFPTLSANGGDADGEKQTRKRGAVVLRAFLPANTACPS